MIYFIQAKASGPIRIGSTIDLASRFADHSKAIGSPVCVLGVVRGLRPEEIAIHHRFHHLRLQGEWFRDAPELREYISSNAVRWDGSEPDIHLSTIGKNPRTTGLKVGEKFGKWEIVGEFVYHRDSRGTRLVGYPCRCECGTERVVVAHSLIGKHTKSCGCMKKWARIESRRIHSSSGKPLYQLWRHIIGRCYNPKNGSYTTHGAVGIAVCRQWQRNYRTFRDWACNHGYIEGFTIERINLDGDYEPSNCRCVPRLDRGRIASHRRPVSAFGEEKSLAEWARDSRCKVSYSTLKARLQNRWNPEEALSSPSDPNARRRRHYLAFGENKSLQEWVNDPRCKVSCSTLKFRITVGWPTEKAITVPAGHYTGPDLITAFGETKTYKEWAKDLRCSVRPDTIRSRLKKGWSPEKAISTPPSTQAIRIVDRPRNRKRNDTPTLF